MSRGLQNTLIVVTLLLLGFGIGLGLVAWVQAPADTGVFATVGQRIDAVFAGVFGAIIGGGAGAIIVLIRRGGIG
jgi:hypothetical protein